MSELAKNASSSFKDVVKKFLGNKRARNYTKILQKLLKSYKALGCNLDIKLHSLHSHLPNFLESLWEVSDEQGERFHQHLYKNAMGKLPSKLRINEYNINISLYHIYLPKF